MKKTALVIMAAGIGSRFGEGIKQLEPVGPSGEIIMDYSIYDALAAGFNQIIFIIRKDLEADFRAIIGNRIERHADVAYAYQELNDLPAGFAVPDGRKKPWGTAQAVLAAKNVIDCPFLVINADDFYGKEGFQKVHDYLVNEMDEESRVLDLCMAGFVLGNTLSENGTVARGVCRENADGTLQSVTETFEIGRKDGIITGKDGAGNACTLSADAVVSMNMWGLPRRMLDALAERFPAFLREHETDLKAEYLLPAVIDALIHEGNAQAKILKTNDKWYGMTYHQDRDAVAKAILDMVKQGKYEEKLFG